MSPFVAHAQRQSHEGVNTRLPPHLQQALKDFKNKDNPKAKAPPVTSLTNIRVSVKRITNTQRYQRELGALFGYADHGFGLTAGNANWPANGMQLAYVTDKFMAQFRAYQGQAKIAETENTQLVFADGTHASLFFGQQRWTTPLVLQGQTYSVAYLQQHNVGVQLEVSGKILESGHIRLTLTPRFSNLKDERTVNVTQLATTVTIPDGGAIVIGGNNAASQSLGSALFSWRENRSTTQQLIMLKASSMTLAPVKKKPLSPYRQ